MAATSTLKQAVLNAYFRTDPVYVSLFDGAPDGAGTEVSGTGYSRTAVTFGAPDGSDVIANSSAVSFGTAGGAWCDVTHFGIHTDASAGDLYIAQALTVSKNVSEDDPVRFPAGELTVDLNA